MKKLALALVCLLSVAFFASCTPEITNPEPSIAVKTGEGYISDGAILNLDTEYKLGIMAASNTQTMKELANFRMEVKIFSNEGLEVDSYDSTWLINGSEFEYEETWSFGEAKDLVGTATITATVTDVAGKFNSVKLDISLNQPAQDLEPEDFTWVRVSGNPGEGLEELGLKWERNGSKEDFAVLEPMEGAILYGFTSDDWGETVTDLDKAQLFSPESMHVTMDKFTGVSAWSSKDYDFVLGTVYNGEYNLIHITRGEVDNNGAAGTTVKILGQVK